MAEIAVINASSQSDEDVAYAAEACDRQLREHFCPRWEGVEYTPVRFYANATDLPVTSDMCRLMVVSDTIDVDGGAVAYHTMDPLIRGVCLAGDGLASRLSHECLEEAADPTASDWVKMPNGQWVALEVADPVEADEYPVVITILGRPRPVSVSNFVLPAWFGIAQGQLDYLGLLKEPFTLRPQSYMVVRDRAGNVDDVWADQHDPVFAAKERTRKVLNSTGRSFRRGLR